MLELQRRLRGSESKAGDYRSNMRIIVIGAGLGGLACAIACRREGLEVLLVERAPQILPVLRYPLSMLVTPSLMAT